MVPILSFLQKKVQRPLLTSICIRVKLLLSANASVNPGLGLLRIGEGKTGEGEGGQILQP